MLVVEIPAGLQHLLHVLQLFCGKKLLSVNMSKTQVVIFHDFRPSRSDSFLYGGRALRIVDHYTYLGIVLHKSGCFKAAIEKLAAAGKRALFAMQYRCSELGLDDTHLCCSLFSSLVQPVLSYGCDVWCLERSSLFSQMNTVHNHFMKRTLHVRKSVPEGVVLCELGRVPLQFHRQKMVLKYVTRLSELPSDRLVKKAFIHASSVNTLWWQKLSLWLSQHGFEGVLAEGTFSLANAEQHLRDKWYHGICQSSATKVRFFHGQHVF